MPPETRIARLIEIMATLRRPVTGCPWDAAQTSASIARYAVEEAYEVVDAIERGDMADLCDELGDLLLQVVFHARIAEEAGEFGFSDIVDAVCAKLVRRHPHVFGDRDSLEQPGWDAIKAEERRAKRPAGEGKAPSLLADIPAVMPGLMRAVKLQQRASQVGFDWGSPIPVLAKIREELDEIEEALATQGADEIRGEIGDLLFAVANLARHASVDPDTAVRETNRKFERRFGYIEERLAERGSSPAESNLAEMDALWTEAKRQGL